MNEITAIKQAEQASAEPGLPHNIEAEQQLLGAILTNNDCYDKISSVIRAEHFFDPVHARIYDCLLYTSPSPRD